MSKRKTEYFSLCFSSAVPSLTCLPAGATAGGAGDRRGC